MDDEQLAGRLIGWWLIWTVLVVVGFVVALVMRAVG